MTLTEYLKGIADAIRGKTGETGEIPASQFAEKISNITTGGSLVNATVTSESSNIFCNIEVATENFLIINVTIVYGENDEYMEYGTIGVNI